MRASSDAMDGLHAILAEGLTEELRRNLERSRLPRDHKDYEPLSPKTAAVAAKFLKDNGIDAPSNSPRVNGLVDQLKTLEVDGESAFLN